MSTIDVTSLEDLPRYSLQEWIKATEDSLKNGSLSDLELEIGGIKIHPILDFTTQQALPPLQKQRSDWYIGMRFPKHDSAEALNKHILQSLNLGTEAISIHVENEEDLRAICKGIQFEYIYTEIKGIQSNGTDMPIDIPSAAHGFIHSDDSQAVGNFHSLTIESKSNNIIDSLSEICLQVIKQFDQNPKSPARIRFSLSLGTHIPLSVSTVRAMRILWLNLLKAYGLPLIPAFIVCNQISDATDPNAALIELSTMAMNAVLGGCDMLYLDGLHFDANQRRLAMNIQHIMKMESKLHTVQDPLAGAYSIEHITQQIVEKVWHNISLL